MSGKKNWPSYSVHLFLHRKPRVLIKKSLFFSQCIFYHKLPGVFYLYLRASMRKAWRTVASASFNHCSTILNGVIISTGINQLIWISCLPPCDLLLYATSKCTEESEGRRRGWEKEGRWRREKPPPPPPRLMCERSLHSRNLTRSAGRLNRFISRLESFIRLSGTGKARRGEDRSWGGMNVSEGQLVKQPGCFTKKQSRAGAAWSCMLPRLLDL